jgi:trehalose utilization protein
VSKTKTKLKTFEVVLGNLETRPGHRKSCAQLAATIRVHAETKEQALDLIQKRWGDGMGLLADDSGRFSTRNKTTFTLQVSCVVSTLTLRDVQEVTRG